MLCHLNSSKLWQNSKTQIVTKLKLNCDNSKTQFVKKVKISNYDKTLLKLWQHSKIQIVIKLRNTNCDNSKTQIVTKRKNSNCDNSKAQIVIKLKTWIMTKLSCDSSDSWDSSEIFLNLFYSPSKLEQNSKTQIVTRLQNSCDKTQLKTENSKGSDVMFVS